MPAAHWAELSTEAFGRWAAKARLVLPVPLNAGHAARVELTWDELAQVSDERLEISNDVAPQAEDADGLPPSVTEVLRAVEPILREPQWCVYAGRVDAGGSEQLVIALSRGTEAVVVVDTEHSTRVIPCSDVEASQFLVDELPSNTAAKVTAAEVDPEQLAAVGAVDTSKGLTVHQRNRALNAGLNATTLRVMTQAEQTPVRGMIGAIRYDGDDAEPSQECAEWFETASGAILKRTMTQGRTRIEPATPAALRRAAVRAIETVRTPARATP